MLKNYANWAKVQKYLDLGPSMPYCLPGTIFWCSLGLNIGHEENGKGRNFTRPVLVLHSFSNKMALVVPLTSQNKFGKNYYQILINGNQESLILSQARSIDTRRLGDFITKIDKETLLNIKRKFIEIIS